MSLDLFAGIAVHDYGQAKAWYTQLLGSEPSWAEGTEAVWELAEHRSIVIEQNGERAGHAFHTVLIDDLNALVGEIAARGIEPTRARHTATAYPRPCTGTLTTTRSASAAGRSD